LVTDMKPIPALLPGMRRILFPTIVLISATAGGATPVTGIASGQTAIAAAQLPCEEIVTAASAEGRGAMTIPAELDLYIECEMRERHIPGVALAITHNGEILTERAYGLASIQNNAPVTTGTRFAIASITKPITAMGILLLVEEGKVELDAPVSRYLTEAPPEWHAMTVRHLLNHTSGLPETGHGWAEWANQGRDDLLRLSGMHRPEEPLYRLSLQDTLWFAPGTDWVYSDVGYFLLGVITGRASGMPWRQYIHERIFLPLGMTDSYISDIWTIYSDEARGYAFREGRLVNIRRDLSRETPSQGGIFSNVGDLAKLDAALSTDQILSEESRRTMWAPTELPGGQIFPYGLGWEVWRLRGHRAQYHSGVTGAEFLRLPDNSLAVIVLTNLGSWGTRYGIAQNVAKLLIPKLKRPAVHEVPVTETELHRYTGQYASLAGDPLEVKLVDGRLIAPYPWPFPRPGGEAELIHQGDHVFEFVDYDGRIVFQLAEDGTIAGLSAVAWDGGYRYDYKRTAPQLPPSPQPGLDSHSHVLPSPYLANPDMTDERILRWVGAWMEIEEP
jgi:CubicO group peptidase (beta-lactamase class C family)